MIITIAVGPELSMGWVGLGQPVNGLGWIGSHKMDPWTTLSRPMDSVKTEHEMLKRFDRSLSSLNCFNGFNPF